MADQQQAPFRTAETASLLLEVLNLGAQARLQGTCLGIDLVRRVQLDAGALVLKAHGARGAKKWRWHQLTLQHVRGGHAPGCALLGVSLAEIESLAVMWGGPASGRYLCEPLNRWADFEPLVLAWVLARDDAHTWACEEITQRITPISYIPASLDDLRNERRLRHRLWASVAASVRYGAASIRRGFPQMRRLRGAASPGPGSVPHLHRRSSGDRRTVRDTPLNVRQ